MSELSDAEIVIIGGGAIGCGVAYALAKAGKTDLLVLERAEDVGRATTSQGAGLCGQTRDSVERTRLAMHSVEVFRELQRESDVKPDWHEVGSVRLALSEAGAQSLRQLKTVADSAGLDTELVAPSEAHRLWPIMNFSAVTAVLWCPSDGWMTPRSVAKAYEAQSRKRGARLSVGTAVERIALKDGRVDAVHTNRGVVRCRYVINAAGAHAYHVAQLAGLELPIVPVRHEYSITVPMPELRPDLPCFRVPELTLYGRVRDGGLLLGGWERAALHTDPRVYPLQGNPPEIDPDWPVLEQFESSFTRILPIAAGRAKQYVGKGWPTFTPDGRFIIGESRRVKGFVMAGGCNAHGISGSGGIGRLLVESLLDPNPSDYVKSLSPDRFTETAWDWDSACVEARRIYETYYGPGCS